MSVDRKDGLEFDQWLELNEDEIAIMAAESGSDRELCFDSERYAEKLYERAAP